MEERTVESKWLKFESGQEVTVRFLEERATRDTVHWVQGKPVLCGGQGCNMCNVDMPRRSRCHVDVEVNGERKVLTLAETGFDQMLKEEIDPDNLKGALVAILPIGGRQGRRYKFRRLERPDRVAEPRAKTTESINLAGLYSILDTWEHVLLGIETQIISLRESIVHMMDVAKAQQNPIPRPFGKGAASDRPKKTRKKK